MSRRVFVAIVLALVAGAGPAAHVSARARPALRLVAVSPVSVHGSGFGARERVRVRVRVRASGARTASRHVRATRRGRFTVGFSRILIDRCAAFSVTAVGRSGRRATLRRARPQCPPA
jgi:hypothetical protein